MKIIFIVLHYLNKKETIDCVNSILSINYYNKEIIIVDNGSKNGTGEELVNLYKENNLVRVIISNENLGFANGNNLGIRSVENKKDSLLVICNSDLIFYKNDFGSKIVNLYEREKYAVLGPEIISEDGLKHECPTEIEFNNIEELKNEIRKFRLLMTLNSWKFKNMARVVHKILAKTRTKFSYDKQMDNKEISIKVHGSCFILSPIFFEKYDGLFEGTFLFQEENILGYMCKSAGLKVLFCPDPSVIHLGSRSYKVKHSDEIERFCNYIVNCYKSLSSYEEYLAMTQNNIGKSE